MIFIFRNLFEAVIDNHEIHWVHVDPKKTAWWLKIILDTLGICGNSDETKHWIFTTSKIRDATGYWVSWLSQNEDIEIDLTFSSNFLENETLGHPSSEKKTIAIGYLMTSRISLLQPNKFWVHWRYTLRLFDGQLKNCVVQSQGFYRIFHHFPTFCCLTPYFLSDGYLIFGYIWCFISRLCQFNPHFPLFSIIFSSFSTIFHHFPSFSIISHHFPHYFPSFSTIFHHFPTCLMFFGPLPTFFVTSPAGFAASPRVSLFSLSCAAYRFSWMAPALAMTCLGFLEGRSNLN